ncbi:hypothetical protein LCL95_04295 [Bacillus timonensis]|nr:hypothetical protein [Bacillus timonensis]
MLTFIFILSLSAFILALLALTNTIQARRREMLPRNSIKLTKEQLFLYRGYQAKIKESGSFRELNYWHKKALDLIEESKKGSID